MVIDEKDKGFKEFKMSYHYLNSKKVAVGLFEKEGRDLINIGVVNEFGAKVGNSYIPERSFMRSTYNKQFKKISNKFGRIAKSISNKDYNVLSKLLKIGIDAKIAIKKTIITMKTPANAPTTIRNKGFDDPLIETGYMKSKISSEVRNK